MGSDRKLQEQGRRSRLKGQRKAEVSVTYKAWFESIDGLAAGGLRAGASGLLLVGMASVKAVASTEWPLGPVLRELGRTWVEELSVVSFAFALQ
jgi:hypothetical protein